MIEKMGLSGWKSLRQLLLDISGSEAGKYYLYPLIPHVPTFSHAPGREEQGGEQGGESQTESQLEPNNCS